MEIIGVLILLFFIFPLWDNFISEKDNNPYPECKDTKNQY